jgi:hypothetical protein
MWAIALQTLASPPHFAARSSQLATTVLAADPVLHPVVNVPLQEDFVPFIRLLFAFFYLSIFSASISTVWFDSKRSSRG